MYFSQRKGIMTAAVDCYSAHQDKAAPPACATAAALPAELLLPILALSEPLTQQKVAICLETIQLSRTPLVRHSWALHLILHRSMPMFKTPPHQYPTNDKSQLARFLVLRLQHRLPGREADDDFVYEVPRVAALSPIADSILSPPSFLNWIFSCQGPLHVARPFTETEFQACMDITAGIEREVPLNEDPLARVRRHWLFVPDAFRMFSFFTQLGDCTSAAFVLEQLLRVVNPHFTLHRSVCLQLSVDPRACVASVVSYDPGDQATMSIEQWLYWTVLLEWSPALLDMVDSMLHNLGCIRDFFHYDPDLLSARRSPFHALLQTFSAPKVSPDRFLPIFNSLERHGVSLHSLGMYLLEQRIDDYGSVAALVCRFPPSALADRFEDYHEEFHGIGGEALILAGKHGDMNLFHELLASGLWQFGHVSEAVHVAVMSGCDEAAEMVHEFIDQDSLPTLLSYLIQPMITFDSAALRSLDERIISLSKFIITLHRSGNLLSTLDDLEPTQMLFVVATSAAMISPRVIKHPKQQLPEALGAARSVIRYLWSMSRWLYRVLAVIYVVVYMRWRVHWMGVRVYHVVALLVGFVAWWLYSFV
ncbi:hypothetical protein BCR44DRAFT_1515453 [Catenaria anguillulae PL171]|uniref:Uncharacterized protein n=1 Tax=Catenaria anguillulae PL171 TaxID=765915 RepID=A0A1Y2HD15_9FUNG|nr:hypothetical protein BCR44DRAFT_1515453 [Catenaria anguillulae PL171]